jgi:hypothetical protein
VKTSPQTLTTKEMAVATQQRTISPQNFYQEQHDCHCPPTVLFSLFPVEDKLKGRHFDTVEVIKAESQVALSTLTDTYISNTDNTSQKEETKQ